MPNGKKITRADTVTLKSYVLRDDVARNREFPTSKPARTRSALPANQGSYNFVVPADEIPNGDRGQPYPLLFGTSSNLPAAVPSPSVQHLKSMSAPHLKPTRKQIIASGGKSGRISIADNQKANGDIPWYTDEDFQEVTQNEKHIVDSAQKYGVDPDFLRSIMWVESTQGWYDRLSAAIDANKSIRPMNINTDYWGDTWGARGSLKDPPQNIAAGARMVKSISTAMPDASIAARATVYNKDRADKVSDYGARVQKVYDQKPWRNWRPRVPGSYRSGERG